MDLAVDVLKIFYSICGTFIGGQVVLLETISWIRWRAEMPASYPAFLM